MRPSPVTACCGAPVRTWHGQGDTVADEALCRECGAETCSKCAASFEMEGGYGEDGQDVRTFATCRACALARAL